MLASVADANMRVFRKQVGLVELDATTQPWTNFTVDDLMANLLIEVESASISDWNFVSPPGAKADIITSNLPRSLTISIASPPAGAYAVQVIVQVTANNYSISVRGDSDLVVQEKSQ